MTEETPLLSLVAEKSLPTKCKPNLLTYCPTMDLIALVSAQDEQLSVYRLNGQRVFGGSFGGDAHGHGYMLDEEDEEDEEKRKGEIKGVRWKNNGHLLAVACADNTIRVISSYSGKTVHHYPAYQHQSQQGDDDEDETTTTQQPKVTCLGWGINFTDSKGAQRYLQEAAGQISVQDLLAPDVHPAKAAALLKADLPRELALLDVESSLPKLSTLPATGSDDDVFSSRASLDAIFHSAAKNTSDSVDVLAVGFDDGTVHLRIFDCFEIGSFQIGPSVGNANPCSLLQHASHPLSSTHALLASTPSPDASTNALQLLTVDLRFITKSGRYLALLAYKTTQLQNLLRYINQVQKQIEIEWKNAQEQPMRFMRSAEVDLQEKCHCDFVTATYHLVVTGDCFAPLKEFLVDILKSQGHKRWDKAVCSGYENIRRLTHECLLPALERCEVLLSRLIGLSKFSKLSDILGLETSDLNAIVETLDCLHLLSHHILINTNEELSQFISFSKWLRHEIDIQSAEPMSQTLEELMERTDIMEYPQTLKYIQGPLAKSSLRRFIQQLPMMGVPRPPPPPSSTADKWAPTGHGRSFYEMFKVLLQQQQQQSLDGGEVEVPKLNDLTKRLGLQFEKVFGQIALTQRRGILHRSPLVLHGDCDGEVVDMAMRYEDAQEGSFGSTYIATRSIKSKHLFYIYRVVLDSVNGVSSTRSTSIAAFDLQEGEIRQLQFVEDDTLMILWSHPNGSSYLLNFPFQPSSATSSGAEAKTPSDITVEYEDCNASTTVVPLDVLAEDPPHASLIRHTFPASAGAKGRVGRIDVNGRKGRRAVCALFGDGGRYEVFDMDAEIVEEDESVQ
ncbi:putative anaphase-promoting complex component Cut20/Apc4 [Aspergillus glaucus CBS 516.65]|uniref:Anaphase-promoting complex subunit 4 n=1 Tax=Aspergillus glaucus CBS 516.65 TaxID=1160497 RepID=A0A1L9VV60_ASPGL|nr:hypothetical protein ASPGLDRAFT_42834 [Aspergillus glaucus CBS 516.65]OJJ87767.1 hypothetical protein ASPGLDRAFT_42834 [Aspergillus glaucus CBS 516.65]